MSNNKTRVMSFVRGLLWFLLSLDGRVGRKPFWLTMLAYIIALYALMALFPHYDLRHPGRVFQIGFIPFIWPLIAVQVKRWHDINYRGWWVLVGMIPILGAIVTIGGNGGVRGNRGVNRFGPPQDWLGRPLPMPTDGSGDTANKP